MFLNSQNIWKRLPLTVSHHHLDRILSCYYILCFLVGNFRGQNGGITGKTSIPKLLTWERGSDEKVTGSKLGHFLELVWGVPINNALYSLHWFIHIYIVNLVVTGMKFVF